MTMTNSGRERNDSTPLELLGLLCHILSHLHLVGFCILLVILVSLFAFLKFAVLMG